jgi:hypothetical protein
MMAKTITQQSPSSARPVKRPQGSWCETPESSVFERFVYVANVRGLGAYFKNGSRYFYAGVPASVAKTLYAAPSVGKFFNQNIKGKYPTTRLA